MEDKKNFFLDTKDPLILDKEVDKPLILNNEINLNSNNQNKRSEIIKIKDLLKQKYVLSKSITKTPVVNNFIKDFNFLKNETSKINNDIKAKTILIKDSIKNQNERIQTLYNEKKLLDKNKQEINQNKNQIQSDIINNQLKLIENNKVDNNKLKTTLVDLEIKLKEIFNKNKSLEINNQELKNTLNKYIIHNKELNKKIKQYEKDAYDKSLTTKKMSLINEKFDGQIKFYQDENIRLSSELSFFQKKYEIISKNFAEVEFEKNSIFKQIQELNNFLNKTDSVEKSIKEDGIEKNFTRTQNETKNNKDNLINNQKNNNPEKNLDGEITDIFN
jgi:hypothetical protein